jgi:hypothetical protein
MGSSLGNAGSFLLMTLGTERNARLSTLCRGGPAAFGAYGLFSRTAAP